MSAFEAVKSGIPEMDAALDSIRLGDNVVWRVSTLDEFRMFALPYLDQAVRDKRDVIYVRFADHDPILPEKTAVQMGIRVVHVELSHRFETFTVDVHHLIERCGTCAFYIFDCLSELQTAWATDLMMGNFFRVTCPFLFQMDTVAYFPLIRGKHSLSAMEKIQKTAQVFLDVYADPDQPDLYYVRPEKVWMRNSDTMLGPHLFSRSSHTFRPVTDGIQTSRFYHAYSLVQRPGDEQNRDSWDHFFRRSRRRYQAGEAIPEAAARMCRIMMTRDEHMRTLVRDNFTPDDYFRVRDRMIGTGMIGGKSCGMLTARKILQNHAPKVYEKLEPHDSFYVGSDVFYSYIVDNGFWDLRVKQRTEEGYFSLAGEMEKKLLTGTFDPAIEARFRFMLDYYGQDPYIVRSSSILEDGFGNAFAGKYESVFCANTGSMEERIAEFENAARTVYASTMSLSALDYRKQRGLDKRDEQMALLVQRVSGSHYGRYFMPCAAGVGYSRSPYKVWPGMDQKAGMLRLVMGLGTAAVDRTEGSYPRLVGLDKPEAAQDMSAAGQHRFSQRNVELIDRKEKKIVQLMPSQILPLLPPYMESALMDHDYDAERMFRERGQNRTVEYISCGGLVRNEKLMGLFRTLLGTLEQEYHYPLDIEYTINLAPDGDFIVNLLQCRPLQAFRDAGAGSGVRMPEHPDPDRVLLSVSHSTMGNSCVEEVDAIVYVDPLKYYQMPYAEKPDIAHLIGRINREIRKAGQTLEEGTVRQDNQTLQNDSVMPGGSILSDGSVRQLNGTQQFDSPRRDRQRTLCVMLMVPGRVGTSSPELGVPVTFADISGFSAICEMAESRIGYNPELSYGSHIFQDLVEMEILYTAVFENKNTEQFRPDLLSGRKNDLTTVLPDSEKWEEAVGVYGFSDRFRACFPDNEKQDTKPEENAGTGADCENEGASERGSLSGTGAHCMLYHDMQQEKLLCLLQT